MDDTLETLNRLVEEGKVRYLGCSNHHCWRLERANVERLNRPHLAEFEQNAQSTNQF